METTKGLRMVSLFTDEANQILRHPLHLLGGRNEDRNVAMVSEHDVSPPGHVTNTGESSLGHVTSIRESAVDHVTPPTTHERYCQSCHAPLATRADQVIHYQLDWHRYNLKRRLRGNPPVTQEEFEQIAGDLSSISGSESSASEEGEGCEGVRGEAPRPQTSGSPLLRFVAQDGTLFAVYKTLLSNAKVLPAAEEVQQQLLALREPQLWVVLMRAGGHFAGAVFNGSSVVAHKTFHRYTVRAKRGTAQSVRDSQQGGHAPRSAGASLRRYNELALVQEIHQLLASWAEHIQGAAAIFIRTPQYSKAVFFSGSASSGGQAPFSKDDPRIRSIPFATRRPTLKEVKSVHSKLAAVYTGFTRTKQVLREPETSSKSLKMSSERSAPKQPPVVAPEVVLNEGVCDGGVTENMDGPIKLQHEGDEEEASGEKTAQKRKKKKGGKNTNKTAAADEIKTFPSHIQQLMAVCVAGCEEATMAEMIHSMTPPSSSLPTAGQPERVKEEGGGGGTDPSNQFVEWSDELSRLWGGETLLHLAAGNGNASLVSCLLHHGANPAEKNAAGHTPYFIAKDKPVRDAFRRFMASHPGRYDYEGAQIPSALTTEMERERREKQLEKKRAQRKTKKLREKVRRVERETETLQSSQEEAAAGLSERERRAMAAERRLAQQLPAHPTITRAGVCTLCGRNLAGLVPFERLQFKYCSMECLKQHRTEL